MPITTEHQMEIAIDSLSAIPVEKRLTVLQHVYEYMLSLDRQVEECMEVVNEWNRDPNYVSAVEQIPIEDREQLLRWLYLKILYRITKTPQQL